MFTGFLSTDFVNQQTSLGGTTLYSITCINYYYKKHVNCCTYIKGLVVPRGGPAPEIVDPSGCFPEGPDPPIPLLSISEWIKSRGPSLAFVNQTFLLTLNLDKGTNTLEHFGRSKMIKGQAPQNILGML